MSDYQACLDYVKYNNKYPVSTGSIYENLPCDKNNSELVCKQILTEKISKGGINRVIKFSMYSAVLIIVLYLIYNYTNNNATVIKLPILSNMMGGGSFDGISIKSY